jgi:hypothetical protein
MRAEDLDNLTEKDLQQKADECFIAAEDENIHRQGGETATLRLHLQAQFWLTALTKRRDERVARRDFRMEVAVIALISLEIILSVVGICISIREGNKQTAILENLKTSTAATASTSQTTANALPKLIDQEATSLKSLDQMNAKLQSSLRETGEMIATTEAQLHLSLQQEAERNRRPIIQVTAVLYDSHEHRTSKILNPKDGGFNADTFLLGYSGTDYYVASLALRNIGTADATHVKIEPETSPGMSIVCVEYLGSRGFRYPAQRIQPCEVPSGVNLTLPNRPKDRPAAKSTGYIIPDFDPMYDRSADIYMRVEKNVNDLDLAFSVTADGTEPTRYTLFCHMYF